MKNFLYVLLFLVFACNSEDANDCFQTSGSIIQQTFEVSSFEQILVNRDIELIIKEAPEYSVIVETGENLINDVAVEVVDNQLVLTDHNSCNYVRGYGITKVYVEAPNLTDIRTSSQYEISSDGVLNYPVIRLFSEDYSGPSEFTVGDFRLEIASQHLSITSNNLSFFYILGTVENLFVGFYSGAGRFEGENLIAQNVNVYHRGSNDIVVNPQQTLEGQLRGTGNLISVNQPPIVEVERIYTGQLIFE
ncbi:head GIN domain-containing protein [Winogradskyella sp. SYSU M77433]|uniref:head GIN domain-containing protein n=1 Tax=Winogradskyella sp. SYSU M77433 TaxID=3042722 RepID=UPI0024806745|nr:head GIN domain-containing protein [Winogradskyella sp. SYSU M77433]MDH7911852.1 head GIN domain-containing protein [Winogradskyella sp. SYSU M77433]